MKLYFVGFIGLLGMSSALYAQITTQTTPEKTPYSLVQWVSKNTSDIITINNETNAAITVNITVAGGKVGVDIRNCGDTTHVDPGSSALCMNNNAKEPINFNSDNPTSAAAGTYQIKEQ